MEAQKSKQKTERGKKGVERGRRDIYMRPPS